MLVEDFIIKKLPKTVIYVPNFISHEEEREILSKISTAPKPKWTQLKNRRLQNWGGIPHVKGMIPETIPDWLQKYIDRIKTLNIFEKNNLPNHVLINEYTAGQGIMPHVDGLLFYPIVTTISCGSHTLLNFQPYNKEDDESDISANEKFSLLLEPRSLLVLKDNLYKKYMHGIEEVTEDLISSTVMNLDECGERYEIGQYITRTTRSSLTIRNVPRCYNVKLKF